MYTVHMPLSTCTTYEAIRLRESQKRQTGSAQQTTSEKIVDHAMSIIHCDGSILTILRTWVGSQDEHPGRA